MADLIHINIKRFKLAAAGCDAKHTLNSLTRSREKSLKGEEKKEREREQKKKK